MLKVRLSFFFFFFWGGGDNLYNLYSRKMHVLFVLLGYSVIALTLKFSTHLMGSTTPIHSPVSWVCGRWVDFHSSWPLHPEGRIESQTVLRRALGQKIKFVMLPSPDQNLKIGSVGRDYFFFFFFFFFFTYRERVEFSNIF